MESQNLNNIKNKKNTDSSPNTNTKNTNSKAPRPLSILVYRDDLKSVIGSGLPKVGWFRRKKIFRTWKRVLVEAAPAGTKDCVFFAPDNPINGSRATPTEFVNINPDGYNDLVHQGDNFEISFVGMSISAQDGFAMNNNELFLYSLTKEDKYDSDMAAGCSYEGAPPTSPCNGRLVQVRRPRKMRSSYYTRPTGFSPSDNDFPFIHYDPVVDGHDVGDEPDAFVPIPASKSLYYQSNCREKRRNHPEKCVPIRFTVLEIDEVSDTQIRAIAGLGDVGQAFGQGAVALPYLELLSGAIEIASLLGKKGLQKYSRPDHVLSKDIEFKLFPAARDARNLSSGEQSEADPRGAFLRYGYYFFLNKSVDAKLYAQTGSSSQQVPLLLRRENFDQETAPKNEKPYFPLTGMSYVVVKVTRGCTHSASGDRESMKSEHRRRLDSMLQMSSVIEMFANFEESNSTWGSWGSQRQRQRKRKREPITHGKRNGSTSVVSRC